MVQFDFPSSLKDALFVDKDWKRWCKQKQDNIDLITWRMQWIKLDDVIIETLE